MPFFITSDILQMALAAFTFKHNTNSGALIAASVFIALSILIICPGELISMLDSGLTSFGMRSLSQPIEFIKFLIFFFLRPAGGRRSLYLPGDVCWSLAPA